MTQGDRFEIWVREIAEDRERGAAQLARRCLEILAQCARDSRAHKAHALWIELQALASRLQSTRPAMAPIRNLTSCWSERMAGVQSERIDEVRQVAIEVCEELIAQSEQAAIAIGRHAAELIDGDKTIFTHSISSTILAAFRTLNESGVRAIVTASRPLCEGRLLAKRLAKMCIPVTYITDAQMGLFVGRADMVLVGADSVLADGSVVNKCGTYLLALAAREYDVPLYVCCERFKFDDARPEAIDLEEMPIEEIDAPQSELIEVRNIYFDVTPPELVTGWITEDGLMRKFKP